MAGLIALFIVWLIVWGVCRAAKAMALPPRPDHRNVIPLSVFPQSPSYLLEEARALQPVRRRVPAVVEVVGVPATAPKVAVEAPPIRFAEGEPRTFDALDAQPAVVATLKDAIAAMQRDGHLRIDPQMFLGPPGMGKTLFAKVTAAEIGRALGRQVEFYETRPADLPNVDALDAALRRCHEHPGSVLFIDEIHDLNGSLALKLYLVLEEQKNGKGGAYLFKGDEFPTQLNPFTLMAATTDSGLLHQALKRRWVNHQFAPANREQLMGYVTRRGFPIKPSAAELIVSRTHFSGAPWEALALYELAVKRAKARASMEVTLADAAVVVDRLKLDELGLDELDRSVIKALLQPSAARGRMVKGKWQLTHYALSEADLTNAVQIDPGLYRSQVKRKLLARGLLTTRGGQALTPKAVKLYGAAA